MKPGPDKQFDPDLALTRAIEVFMARGYEAASMSDLTAAMGIGKQSLYDTFGNKRSLFLKALNQYCNTAVGGIRERLFDPASGSTLDNVRGMLSFWLECHSQPCSRGCLIGTSIADFDTTDEEVASALRRGMELIEDAFTEAIAKAEVDGEIRLRTSPRNIARTILCLSQGMALMGRVLNSGDVLESAVHVAETELLGTS